MASLKTTDQIFNFIEGVLPFHLLPASELRDLVPELTVEHFAKDQVVLSPDGPPTGALYLIHTGGVRLFIPPEKDQTDPIAIDLRGEGELFGFFSLLSNRPSPFTIVTDKETECFLLKKERFLRLMDDYSAFLLYFTMGPSKGFKPGEVINPEDTKTLPLNLEPDILLFSARIHEIMHTHVATCGQTDTAMAAAQLMTQKNVGCLVVRGKEREPAGILTDGDLRRKVVASGSLVDLPVAAIMSHPLISVPSDYFLFDAILLMIQKGIKYLPVMDKEELKGIISERDLMISQGNNPVAVIRKIQQSPSVEDLVLIRKDMHHSMRLMLERGGNASEICQLITQLNDHLVVRVIELSMKNLLKTGKGPPPIDFAWVALGSEGRQEQTLSTDQDNALVFADSDPVTEANAIEYFLALANLVVTGLEQCGFPRCNGDIMASNPHWCQPLRAWKEYYHQWVFQRDLSSQDILISSIFFDFRFIFGQETIVRELKASVFDAIPESKVFLPHMALRSLELKAPLSFFKRLVVERSGKYKNHLNIKRHGLLPLIDPIRILSLEQLITKTNTLERIESLVEAGVFSSSEGKDLSEAFSLMTILRLQHHMELMKEGKDLHDYTLPSELSMMQRYNLKMSFKAIERLQGQIEIRYGLTALRTL